MNVMTQAHKKVKALLAKITARYVGQYAAMLKVALIETHKESKAMNTKPDTKTVEGQQAIRKQGADTFKGGTSSNPYNEGTLAHDLFKDGWIEASQKHYSNQGV